jgi:hypothetical protein
MTLKENCKDYLRTLIGEGGLWIRGMVPILEETSPRITHSLTNMNDMIGEIIIRLRKTQEIVSLDLMTHTLLIPNGKFGSSLST